MDGLRHQPFQPLGDVGRGGGEALLHVIGAQHDDEQVYGLMGHETGVDGRKTAEAFKEGILEGSGPAAQTLLPDQIGPKPFS